MTNVGRAAANNKHGGQNEELASTQKKNKISDKMQTPWQPEEDFMLLNLFHTGSAIAAYVKNYLEIFCITSLFNKVSNTPHF
ncbi:8006_t:CDS:2 [Paraglomus occultum]|uniref:8006_t:CDS:1 n=1 Tax=Paraglomus occultum TaxID=144539 RepID=A0A9N9AAN5_9GLOM|nr:8006_t:CDS:2 [Paraglomus occultum]